MAYDGSLSFDTQLNTDGFNDGLKKLEKSTKDGMSVFGGTFFGSFISNIVDKGIGMIMGSVDKAMSRLDTMAQFSRVLNTMTGSATMTAEALDKVNSVVSGTAFGLDTAAAGVQNFVAAGMEVSQATDTISAWADAVAFYTKGTNQELATVENALQKMQTKGTVTMEHLQMLLEAGVPAVQIYADAVGMSTEEVTAQMGKGELRTSDFISVMNDAFKAGTEGFPAIAGAAKEAGTSWAGSMDNTQAAITRGVASILESFDKLYDAKSGMVQFGKTIESGLKVIGENLDMIIPILGGATAAFIAFKSAMAITNVINKIGSSFLNLGTMIGTAVYKIGQSISKLNAAMASLSTGSIIGIVITAVVALIGVIDGLSNKIDGFQKKYEDLHNTIEDQISANNSLLESLKTVDAEYEKSLGHIENVENANTELINRIEELRTSIASGTISDREKEAAQRELIQCTNELNDSVSGLGLEYDAMTNSLNMSIDSVRDAIEMQSEYAEAAAKLEHANSYIEKKIELEDELWMTELRLKNSTEELTDLQNNIPFDKGIVEMWDWGKATKEACDNVEELADQQLILEDAIDSYVEKAKKEKEVQLEVLQGMNSQLETLDEVAAKYGLTAEEIKKAMELQGITLDEWETKYKENFTDENLSLEQLAAQWGTTTEAIKAEMEAQGISAEEWETNQEAKLEEWKNAVATKTDEVINNFKELPTSMDISLEEMVTNLNDNAAKYQEWRSLITQATGTLSNDVIAYFNKMGTGSLEILKECLNDPQKAAEINLAFGNAVNAGVVGAEAETKKMYTVGENAIKEVGSGAGDNSGEVTEVINEAIAGSSDDIIQIMSDLNIGISDEIKNMRDRARIITQEMVNAMVTAFGTIKSRMATVVVQMFAGMLSAMNDNEGKLYSKADRISANIARRFEKAFDINSPSKVMQKIFSYVMQGAYRGMESEENTLYGKVDEISENISDKFALSASGMYAAINGNQSKLKFAAAASYGQVSSQNSCSNNFTQIVNSPVALSPSELTREAVDAQKRQKWQLP